MNIIIESLKVAKLPNALHLLCSSYITLTEKEKIYYERNWHKFDKKNVCCIAAENGWLDLLIWARFHNRKWNEYTLSRAAHNGHLEILKYAYENGLKKKFNSEICSHAAKNGHLEIIKWAHSIYCKWNRQSYINAIEFGQLDVLIWALKNCSEGKDNIMLFENFSYMNPKDLCGYAIHTGKLEIIKWLKMNGYNCKSLTYEYVISCGEVEIMKWMIENGYKLNETLCNIAARYGYLEIIKLLKQNECPYNINEICIIAAKNGDLEILKWIVKSENGYEVCKDENICKSVCSDVYYNDPLYAIKKAEMLKWLIENGCKCETNMSSI